VIRLSEILRGYTARKVLNLRSTGLRGRNFWEVREFENFYRSERLANLGG
jgi:hypothetical protein